MRYVGRSTEPSDQRPGDLGTVRWAGDIEHQPGEWLRDWVLVDWDTPVPGSPYHMRLDNVEPVR